MWLSVLTVQPITRNGEALRDVQQQWSNGARSLCTNITTTTTLPRVTSMNKMYKIVSNLINIIKVGLKYL